MAKELANWVGRDVSEWIATYEKDVSQEFRVERAVDISLDCPEREDTQSEVLLMYSSSGGRSIVHLVQHFEHGSPVYFHWDLNSLDKLCPEKEGIFKAFAQHFGHKPEAFCQLIRQNAPSKTTVPA